MSSTTSAHVCHYVLAATEEEDSVELSFVSGTKAKSPPPEEPPNAETVVSGDHHQFVLSERVEIAGISRLGKVHRARRKKELGAIWVAEAVDGGGPETTQAGPGAVAGAAAGANAGNATSNPGNGPSSAIDGAVVGVTT